MPEPRTFRDEPVSFVRRSGRMSDAQERAFEELGPHYLLDVPRDVAWTSVHPEARLDHEVDLRGDVRNGSLAPVPPPRREHVGSVPVVHAFQRMCLR